MSEESNSNSQSEDQETQDSNEETKDQEQSSKKDQKQSSKKDQEQSNEEYDAADDYDDEGDDRHIDDDDEDRQSGLTREQKEQYRDQMRIHNRQAAAFRSALKNNRLVEPDDSERSTQRLQRMEERAQRAAVKEVLMDAEIPAAATELVFAVAKFDDYQELRNPKEVVKTARHKIKALIPKQSNGTSETTNKDVGGMPGSSEESKATWFKVADNHLD